MNSQPLQLDGSVRGPDVLRTALAASLLSRRPFVLTDFRGSAGPGLQAADVALLRAARAISGSAVEGGELASAMVAFSPGPVRAGDYLLDLGGAAIADGVQLLGFPLTRSGGASRLKLRGATHLEGRPVWHELLLVWEPAMRHLGFDFGLELRAAGYAHDGGGEADLTVRPGGPAVAFERRTRGTLVEARVLSAFSRLPLPVAVAQSERAQLRLREHGIVAEADNLPLPAPRSKGASCMVLGRFERGVSAFSALHRDSDPVAAADEAGRAFCAFMQSGGGVSPSEARGLLLPLSMGAAGMRGPFRPISRFSTSALLPELASDAEILGQFLDVEIDLLGAEGREGEVRVAPAGEGLKGRIADRLRSRAGEPS